MRLPPLKLLESIAGDTGIDAIVIHTTAKLKWWERLLPRLSWNPRVPSAESQRSRYEIASLLFPLHASHKMRAARERAGAEIQRAWKLGVRPDFRRTDPAVPPAIDYRVPSRAALRVVR